MSRHELNRDTATLGRQTALRERLGEVRENVARSEPRDIVHELPGVIDELQDATDANGRMIRVVVGVSFSTNDSLFDYHLLRVVVPPGEDDQRVETLKEPISEDHLYLRFAYPEPAEVDAGVFRRLLLTAIETEIHSLEQSMTPVTSRLPRLLDVLRDE